MIKAVIYFFMILTLFNCTSEKGAQKNPSQNVMQESVIIDASIPQLSGENAFNIIHSKTIKLVDVRTYEELLESPRITGARNFDVSRSDFIEKLDMLNKYQPYLIYSNKGVRSQKACKIMLNRGFKSIYNLEGGYEQYKREGYLDY